MEFSGAAERLVGMMTSEIMRRMDRVGSMRRMDRVGKMRRMSIVGRMRGMGRVRNMRMGRWGLWEWWGG